MLWMLPDDLYDIPDPQKSAQGESSVLQGWRTFQNPRFSVISFYSREERSEGFLVAWSLLSCVLSLWPKYSSLGPAVSNPGWLRHSICTCFHVLSFLQIPTRQMLATILHQISYSLLAPMEKHLHEIQKPVSTDCWRSRCMSGHTAGVYWHMRGHTLTMHTPRCHFVNNALLPSLFCT